MTARGENILPVFGVCVAAEATRELRGSLACGELSGEGDHFPPIPESALNESECALDFPRTCLGLLFHLLHASRIGALYNGECLFPGKRALALACARELGKPCCAEAVGTQLLCGHPRFLVECGSLYERAGRALECVLRVFATQDCGLYFPDRIAHHAYDPLGLDDCSSVRVERVENQASERQPLVEARCSRSLLYLVRGTACKNRRNPIVGAIFREQQVVLGESLGNRVVLQELIDEDAVDRFSLHLAELDDARQVVPTARSDERFAIGRRFDGVEVVGLHLEVR